MATHLVTGGAGFLGAQTARALHARGERVRVLDILPAPELPAGIEYLRADILDAARVAEAMAGVDVVHHHAALVPLTKAGRRLWRVNVDGTQQALDAAREAGGRGERGRGGARRARLRDRPAAHAGRRRAPRHLPDPLRVGAGGAAR